ncbi:MAG TPA: CARDB domain-containing protein, partial [Gaiellaceae bacterium]|nr:CARDB domain-containing protein [Gaiellaceae bacterium]
ATAGKSVKIEFIDGDGTVVDTQNVTTIANPLGRAQFNILPDQNWDPGEIKIRATVAAPDTGTGEARFTLNPLEVTVLSGDTIAPGDPVTAEGTVTELDSTTCCLDSRTPVPANVSATLHGPDGTQLAGPVTTTATSDGEFTVDFPGSATEGLQATAETNFELELAVRATATYNDPTPFVSGDVRDAASPAKTSGAWAGSGSGPVVVRTPPDTLLIENSFVSSSGWVKPGDSYPFRVYVKNFTTSAASNAQVTIPAPDGVTFTQAKALAGSGTASAGGSSVTWSIPTVASGDTATLVVEAKADSIAQDEQIVWKDLSSTATLTYEGHSGSLSDESHGPKVIPPSGGYETARYGDKPFPIVPVDYTDRKHEERHSGDALARKVNSPDVDGSTFNLYQEMSYGQLHPFGSVPSVGIATAGWDYPGGFRFSERELEKPTCRGFSYSNVNEVRGTPLYPERIHDGWYQLPGDTEYYGGDYPVFTATSAFGIDSACGETSKSVYDAAVIADPEIDYNNFDGDKDGVVDFFMMVFVGEGGNGASQLGGGYDNIWPHSSSLEFAYEDEATGLAGYISDDQLTDHEGVPQCWTDATYSESADCQANGGTGRDDLPTYVRVGPYNVNPETAIDQASVIAHEYGHYLGLPDFYSNSYSAYNDWNLMATDFSQHMTVFGKQDLGWVVPRFLQPGETRNVSNWNEIKNDTGEIQWQTPDGEPYTLSEANGDQNIHNGEAYALKLPRRLVIDPEKVRTQASAPWIWWSGRGNDFGCSPKGGHNLDIALPELENVAAGTPITVQFKSSFDIEWDFDYGFVQATTDGVNYTSLPSAKGFTTSKATNPNGIGCLDSNDNGLTGTSGAHGAGAAQVAHDRATTSYDSGSPFVEDEYNLSAYAGARGFVLRLSYFTDGGLDRPGWFIDDLEVRAGNQVLYSSDFSEEDPLRLFPGGCGDEGRKVAAKCTDGWSRIQADQPSELDHAYYLELRDRSGFDFEGRGQADRGLIGWAPGVLVEYTDEVRGYGNNGSGTPPRQHYLDSQPQPDYDCGDNLTEEHPEPAVLTAPRCQDAAFTAAAGDNMFRDVGWVDNFWDESSEDGLWHFDYGCLTLNVNSMAGDTGNSEALPSDLTANATISAGAGCSTFEYWAGLVNAAPTAVASATPKEAAAGETVTFSAAGSFDDLTSPEDLTYEWAFGDGSTGTGATATHAYAAKGTYQATLTVTDSGGLTDTDTVSVTVAGPDLQVTDVSAPSGKLKGGRPVTVTATVRNAGPGTSPASKTEFLLNGTTVLGVVDTPALSAGQSAPVSVQWTPHNGTTQHVIRATADKPAAVAEENESNNWGQRTFSVQGNRLSNGDFEQQTSSGAPESWSGESTGAGTASSTSSGGTDGSDAAQISGNGGNAAASGSPTWTSAPVSVTAGELLDVTAAVKASGLSSAPSLGLVYLGAAGQVLDTAKVLTVPLQTDGFRTLEQSVTIPPLVTEVRVVLTGFAPTDLATKGTVTFDDVGVFAG